MRSRRYSGDVLAAASRRPPPGQRPVPQVEAEPGLVVGDNQPYQMTDAGDYSIPVYGERRGLYCIMVEIRQDVIAKKEGALVWADRLANLYNRIETRLNL